MPNTIEVNPGLVLPSQDYLKENTVRYILQCFRDGRLDDLPPPPLVWRGDEGRLIALDGHNLLAVCFFNGITTKVVPVTSAEPVFPEDTRGNRDRNAELARKFPHAMEDMLEARRRGVGSFLDLVVKYPDLFPRQGFDKS